MKLFLLELTSPKVGRKASMVRGYVVMAPAEDEVLAVFDTTNGAHHREGCSHTIEAWGSPTAPVYSNLKR